MLARLAAGCVDAAAAVPDSRGLRRLHRSHRRRSPGSSGCNVLDLQPNRGKAGALADGDRALRAGFDGSVVMLLLDADTRLSPDYLQTGLPLFDDPRRGGGGRTGALPVGPAATDAGWAVSWSLPVAALRGGATAGEVRPGRTLGQRGLDRARLAPACTAPTSCSQHRHHRAGLVIEDFNMTFEVHAKKLGRIAFRSGRRGGLHPGPGHLARLRDADQPLDAGILADGAAARPATSAGSGCRWRCRSFELISSASCC